MLIWGCIALAVFVAVLGVALCRIAAPMDYPKGDE